ncbi:MAG: murein L,D-transpeptidase catalytic domain family protein [Alistipes sp.]|nr:murein L,D-transpeptidase catalytic domain family protein [Alistipes sp.]
MSLRSRVVERAVALREFCQREGYNTRVALFVDLSRHSGRNRFVAWDMVRNVPMFTCPVSHGSGAQKSHVRSAYARLSNEDGSHLSSVGRAIVAERYEGRYGVAYRLDGLDATNTNMRPRCVVLHGWEYTTSYPIFPLATVGSFGCPVLSRKMMARVDDILKAEERVIIDIFI